MPIKLLLVDNSNIMRSAIRRLLKKDPGIEVIGTASSFAEGLLLNAALRPDVLLMDLHAKDEREYPPELVKCQIRLHTDCVVAMSLWNDDDARVLAERFGAHVLLDKMKFYSELIPAINQFRPSVRLPKIVEPLGERIESSPLPSSWRSVSLA